MKKNLMSITEFIHGISLFGFLCGNNNRQMHICTYSDGSLNVMTT